MNTSSTPTIALWSHTRSNGQKKLRMGFDSKTSDAVVFFNFIKMGCGVSVCVRLRRVSFLCVENKKTISSIYNKYIGYLQ